MTGYREKVRIRSCGLLIENDSLLLVELLSPVSNELVWTAPGGGVEFGETLEDALVREFNEETGLLVEVKELMHVNEFITENFHAVEFYHKVKRVSGEVKLGYDPEHKPEDQIIKNIAFLSREEMLPKNISPLYLKEGFWK